MATWFTLCWEDHRDAAYGADNGSTIMAPVKVGEHLYVSGYQEKTLLLKFAADGRSVETVWRNKAKHGISAVNAQPFLVDGLLWGYHEKGELRGVAPFCELRRVRYERLRCTTS